MINLIKAIQKVINRRMVCEKFCVNNFFVLNRCVQDSFFVGWRGIYFMSCISIKPSVHIRIYSTVIFRFWEGDSAIRINLTKKSYFLWVYEFGTGCILAITDNTTWIMSVVSLIINFYLRIHSGNTIVCDRINRFKCTFCENVYIIIFG